MLEIDGLAKRFGDIVAVEDVSLRVPRGRIVGFVGPNGAGKSTTMRSIFGLVRPDGGAISWDDAPVGVDALSQFGYMPEQRGLYPKMKVGEQVAFFAELKGMDHNRAQAKAEELLDSLELGDRLGDPLEKLSHGNQQRVQLAVSLVHDPELLILDEPFNGLDPVAVNTLQRVLDTRVAAGAGVLFSSHQLDLVERICDELVVIIAGRVRTAGTVEHVRGLSGHRQVDIAIASEAEQGYSTDPATPDGGPDRRPALPLEVALTEFRILHQPTPTTATVAVDGDRELDALLSAARQAGPVTRFDYDLPSLTDAFTDLSAATAANARN